MPGGRARRRCLRWLAVSAISPDDLRHLAQLARIDLSDAEVDHLAPQLDQIIGLVAKVGEVADDDVTPTSHPLPLTNVFRPDVPQPSIGREAALANAPEAEDERFKVPRIAETGS